MDNAFLQDRITATKAEIVAYEAAILSLATTGAQSYTLDTGQSRQTVTRANLTELRKALEALYNQCATMQARLSGGGSVIMRPGF